VVGSFRDIFEAIDAALLALPEGGGPLEANTFARQLFDQRLEQAASRLRTLPIPSTQVLVLEAAGGRRFVGQVTLRAARLDGAAHVVVSVRECSRAERFAALAAGAAEGLVVHDAGLVVDANEAFARLVEAPDVEGLIGRPMLEVLGLREPPREVAGQDPLSGSDRTFEVPFVGGAGARRTFEVRATTSTWLGQPARVARVLDVSARRQAASEAEALERRLALALAATAESNWEWNYATQRIFYSATWYELMGYPVRAEPMPFAEWLTLVHPDDLDLVLERARSSLGHHPSPRFEVELRMKAADGTWRWMFTRGNVVERDAQGERRVVVGTIGDVTERKRAEAERTRLEGELRQAQKMESIGRLAGGVAHDFNNVLSTVIGNATLALAELRADDPLRELIADIETAANSAAQVTRQLLTLSRKEVIAPRVIDPNEVVLRVQKLLRRLLGEQLEVHTELATPMRPIVADPNQFEQVLVNLCVNARDAMPSGGTLTLSTCTVPFDEASRAGFVGQGEAVVRVAITDTGVGMSDEVRAHLFEPFFTTKPFGKGTGLGLAMVYGAVTQNRGHVHVASAPGQGSTFSLYFPVADAPLTAPEVPPTAALPRGSELILVAEDRPELRTMAVRLLERQGYQVQAYPDGPSLLAALSSLPRAPHLLFTDVVMPGLNGKQLAEQVLARFPGLPVLFTSGYLDDVVGAHGVLDPAFDFLPKPYSLPVLAARVREALDRRG
jgi:PAS domain S-box-containing protein